MMVLTLSTYLPQGWRSVGLRHTRSGQTEGEYVPRMKPLGSLPLMEGPALTLRLRAGFGINAKADVLALLLGLAGAPADLKLIAAATAYTERAVRTAAEEMALAGFIQEVERVGEEKEAELLAV